MQKKKLTGMAAGMLLGLCCVYLQAQEEAVEGSDPVAEEAGGAEDPGAATPPGAAIYLPLKPAFVVNYGGAGRLKYFKTELSVRVASTDVANSVRLHLPYIRNNLVMLFSRQMEENLDSQQGKELLRQQALEEIRKVLKEEDGIDGVIDVYFNTFLVQS